MIILSIRKCQVIAIGSVHDSLVRMGDNVCAPLHAHLVLACSVDSSISGDRGTIGHTCLSTPTSTTTTTC